MEIHQLEYIVEVARQKNFTRASYTLNVTQSTLSHQIAKLENELGIEIFIRKARTVELTQVGYAFLQQSISILKNIDTAKQTVLDFKGLLKGTIRIGMIGSLASIDYSNIIADFYKKYPHLHFYIEGSGTFSLLTKLIEQKLDLAFIVTPPKKDFPDIKFHALTTDDYILAVPLHHPLAHRKRVALSALSKEKFIFYPSTDRIHYICLEACLAAGFQPNIICECDHSPTSIALIQAGMGIGFFPRAKMDFMHPHIAPIELEQPFKKDISLAVLKRGEQTPAVKIFLDFVLQWIEKN